MCKMKRYSPAILILVGLALGGCAWLLRPLEAKLSATPTSGPAPLSVTFSAAGSTGPIVSFTLDFGDGSSPYSGTDITVSISHTYTNPGTYTAVLTVQDAAGRTATDSKTITVLSGTTASLSASPSTVAVGDPVTFTLLATAASGRTLVSWSMDYDGDDTPDATGVVSGTTLNVTVTHTYSAPGTYTAKLTVKDSADYEATAQVVITVQSPPPRITEFKATDGSNTVSEGQTLHITSGTSVSFSFKASPGDSTRKLVKWTLYFGDGAFTGQEGLNASSLDIFSGITQTYTATQTQSYTASLSVWDDLNKSDTAEITIEVTPGP